MSLEDGFEKLADKTARAAGRPVTWLGCCLLIVAWAASGPLLHFSDTWQLIVNTTTTIVTFLMVFLIQSTQNRDSKALQAKLDELLRAVKDARDDYVGLENEPERRMDEKKQDVEQAR